MDRDQKAAIVERLTGERRRAMLPVEPVLSRVGFPEKGRIADIGCGVGYFTLPLAQRTEGTVVAIDVSEDMLGILRERAQDAGVRNIEMVRSGEYDLKLPDGSADAALICNVLHEVDQPARLLAETARVVVPGGKLAVIEWKKEQMPMGPPIGERISLGEMSELLTQTGFALDEPFDVSAACYVVVARRVANGG